VPRYYAASIIADTLTGSRVFRRAVEDMDAQLEIAFQGVERDMGTGPGTQEPLVFDFAPGSEWIVNHNLGRAVQAEVLNVIGAKIGAEVRHVSDNQLRVSFDVPVAGRVVVR
jgi:hypothetical protein